jgi:hypothetical protein
MFFFFKNTHKYGKSLVTNQFVVSLLQPIM